MPKTLDRPPTTEAPAPPVVEPSKAPPAPKRPTPFVRWLGWTALVVLVAAAAVLFIVQATDEAYVDDGSHLVVEEARMARLAPASIAAGGSEGLAQKDAIEELSAGLLAPASVAAGGSEGLAQKDAIEELSAGLLAPASVAAGGSEGLAQKDAIEELNAGLLAPVAVTDDGSSLVAEEGRMALLHPRRSAVPFH